MRETSTQHSNVTIVQSTVPWSERTQPLPWLPSIDGLVEDALLHLYHFMFTNFIAI